MVVAIDGPAGAGKTSVARGVARRLGWSYVDTGAMYRVIALKALEQGVDPDDAGGLESLARSLDLRLQGERVLVDGGDVSEAIRSEEVTQIVSQVSAHPGVRRALVPKQRAMAERADLVIEGRDTGSVVFPNAEVKVFLDAGPEFRALRRAREMGLSDDQAVRRIEASITARDEADSSRSESPLVRPPDAHLIDTAPLSLEEVVDRVVAYVEEARRG